MAGVIDATTTTEPAHKDCPFQGRKNHLGANLRIEIGVKLTVSNTSGQLSHQPASLIVKEALDLSTRPFACGYPFRDDRATKTHTVLLSGSHKKGRIRVEPLGCGGSGNPIHGCTKVLTVTSRHLGHEVFFVAEVMVDRGRPDPNLFSEVAVAKAGHADALDQFRRRSEKLFFHRAAGRFCHCLLPRCEAQNRNYTSHTELRFTGVLPWNGS